jgi:hypothetical protein
MGKTVTIDLNGTYLVVQPKKNLAVLSGNKGEVFFSGRTDELALILAESMKNSEFMRVVIHFANMVYQEKYVSRRPADTDTAEVIAVGPDQLPLFAY